MLTAKDLISIEIPPLKTSDTGLKALSWMDEFRVNHLPIVNGEDFLGLISDTDILDLDVPEESIGNHYTSILKPFVKGNDHLYEVIKQFSSLKLSLLPVVDEQNKYLGVVTFHHLINNLSSLASVTEPGGIIVLEINVNDYSLSQIAQIVESNNSAILSSYVTSFSDSTKLEVTIKVNNTDLTRIIQTFNRYNYTIKASIYQSEFLDDLRQRYDQFMNYLNI